MSVYRVYTIYCLTFKKIIKLFFSSHLMRFFKMVRPEKLWQLIWIITFYNIIIIYNFKSFTYFHYLPYISFTLQIMKIVNVSRYFVLTCWMSIFFLKYSHFHSDVFKLLSFKTNRMIIVKCWQVYSIKWSSISNVLTCSHHWRLESLMESELTLSISSAANKHTNHRRAIH